MPITHFLKFFLSFLHKPVSSSIMLLFVTWVPLYHAFGCLFIPEHDSLDCISSVSKVYLTVFLRYVAQLSARKSKTCIQCAFLDGVHLTSVWQSQFAFLSGLKLPGLNFSIYSICSGNFCFQLKFGYCKFCCQLKFVLENPILDSFTPSFCPGEISRIRSIRHLFGYPQVKCTAASTDDLFLLASAVLILRLSCSAEITQCLWRLFLVSRGL